MVSGSKSGNNLDDFQGKTQVEMVEMTKVVRGVEMTSIYIYKSFPFPPLRGRCGESSRA